MNIGSRASAHALYARDPPGEAKKRRACSLVYTYISISELGLSGGRPFRRTGLFGEGTSKTFREFNSLSASRGPLRVGGIVLAACLVT